MERYVLGIDQSTSGTKAILFDSRGALAGRHDVAHRQIVDDRGWVEHDPGEIYANLLKAISGVVKRTGIDPASIAGAGLSNQRETAIAWNRKSGSPVYNAIVWQCPRGEAICQGLARRNAGEKIRLSTGIPVSAYYSAAKLAWILENVPDARRLGTTGELCCSTMDSWIVFKLCGGEPLTDFSNASRTQLFNIGSLEWDSEICGFFGLEPGWLPRVTDSNSLFGQSDFEGILPSPIPLHGVLGDSHGALYGQGCLTPGAVKATYGTGSSVMMNIGGKPIFSNRGIVTSLAWGIDGRVDYVLEGNINYTGAVIRWLVDGLGMLASSREAESVARSAKNVEGLYLVPAFGGLGAPYWDEAARGVICGLSRGVGKAEIVRAAEECIAYQIADVVRLMQEETGFTIDSLKVDGGPVRDSFLMQFQADVLGAGVSVPEFEELSGCGPARLAGMAIGLYPRGTTLHEPRVRYLPAMAEEERRRRCRGWRDAIEKVLTGKKSS
ncbi:MAG: glycerol kinase GlpK [Planctomycetota bacterium]|jgi:glycerol kinase|nr:glycerol kinase GlpK [Planctomycetota bacterium]